ncbi:MAG: LysM peptidoglycan-binding domain-containing protein, partial [Alphaproteobacteria bacterium]|nr:LysM peptidoglycan-binding domain-containing protein [Alphaproteobacteria bacterium]
MRIYKTFCKVAVLGALVLCACDLQPKIASIPDSIGMFIEDRYPALLADPKTQPEIYESAVTDYGVYASPELYGSSSMEDYVLYASMDDYVLVPEEPDEVAEVSQEQIVEPEPQIEDDYLIVPLYGGNTVLDEEKPEPIKQKDDGTIIVAKGDTVYALARKNNMTVSEFAEINDLHEPYTLSIGQKLTTQRVAAEKPVPNVISVEKVQEIKSEKVAVKEVKEPVKPTETKRVDLEEITVVKGDTLYSLSRKYEIPVNDLAVMNRLSSPFTLSVGQKIKVPKLDNVKTASVSEIKTVSQKTTVEKITPAKTVSAKIASDKSGVNAKTTKSAVNTKLQTTVAKDTKKATTKTNTKTVAKVENTSKQKISSNPKKELPKVVARSSSKFSWPIRGKILSEYGAKNNGLFNDGINIAASQGS